MSEESQTVLYIGYSVIFFLGVTYVISMFLPGLTSVETDIDVTQRQEYRKAIVLENLLSLDGQTEQYGYEYTNRRGVIPVEYFTNYNPEGAELGYRVQGIYATQGHCYIDGVAGLDGQNFAFGIDVLDNEGMNATGDSLGEPNVDFKSVTVNGTDTGAYRACTKMNPATRQRAVVSTAMLVREAKNHSKLPVRLYVYDPFPAQ